MVSKNNANGSLKLKKFLKKHYLDIIFIFPILIFILGFTILPIFKTILMSFKDPGTLKWGMGSYKYVFGKNAFSQALLNTILITAIALTIQITIGFAIALLLKQTFIGKGLARAFVLLPMGIPTLVSGVAMLYVFGTSGYINEILFRLNLIKTPVDWTTGKLISLTIVSIADSWKVMPIVVLLILSGLEAIPLELYEAGNIDGANVFQKFIYITLPQLKPTLTMTILMRVVDLLRIFEMPMVLLGRSTSFLGTLAYDEYQYGNNTYSAVNSTVLLVLIVLTVSSYLFIFERDRGAKSANNK